MTEISENVRKEHVNEREFHVQYWSMVYLILKLKFYSETEIIEFILIYIVNHELERNVEFLFSCKPFTGISKSYGLKDG